LNKFLKSTEVTWSGAVIFVCIMSQKPNLSVVFTVDYNQTIQRVSKLTYSTIEPIP